jgi:hypothetical protein
MMKRKPGRSDSSIETGLLLALPCTVILLSIAVWVTALSRSGFWADDFLNVTHFSRSLGDLSDDHINAGKYIINVFWAVGTEAFGAGSVVPFLLLNSLVFAAGLVIWLRAGAGTRWTSVEAWWVGGLFIATGAWLPTALWSTNITHSGGFLALGVALWAHNHMMKAQARRDATNWALATGLAWTFAVVSNLLYIGFLVLAFYCALFQVSRLRNLGTRTSSAVGIVGFSSLLVPLTYFITVAYPSTTSHGGYTETGLRFVHENLRFYRSVLAPTSLLTALYGVMLVGGLVGALAAMRRRDFFPVTILATAAATALPALVQGQQRDIHYVAMPLLLTFSALAAGVYPLVLGERRRYKGVLLLGVTMALLLIFRQSAEIRAYFIDSPYGGSLASFRSEVASLAPAGGMICARLNLDPAHQAFFIAAMSGEDGFLVPPINAAQAYLVTGRSPCPAGQLGARITVNLNGQGNFVAYGSQSASGGHN